MNIIHVNDKNSLEQCNQQDLIQFLINHTLFNCIDINLWKKQIIIYFKQNKLDGDKLSKISQERFCNNIVAQYTEKIKIAAIKTWRNFNMKFEMLSNTHRFMINKESTNKHKKYDIYSSTEWSFNIHKTQNAVEQIINAKTINKHKYQVILSKDFKSKSCKCSDFQQQQHQRRYDCKHITATKKWIKYNKNEENYSLIQCIEKIFINYDRKKNHFGDIFYTIINDNNQYYNIKQELRTNNGDPRDYIDHNVSNARQNFVGNLLRTISKKYYNETFILISGFIRKIIPSTNWTMERQRIGKKLKITNMRYQGAKHGNKLYKYKNNNKYEFIPKRYHPIFENNSIFYSLVNIITYFYIYPLSKKKSVKYPERRNEKSIIDFLQYKMIEHEQIKHFNHGFAILLNTMRKKCFDWQHCDWYLPFPPYIWINASSSKTFGYIVNLLIFFSYLMHFDEMIFKLNNGKCLYIKTNHVEIFHSEYDLVQTHTHLKLDSLWKLEKKNIYSNYIFEFTKLDKVVKKYKIRKYYLKQAFGKNYYVQKGKIYSNKSDDIIQLIRLIMEKFLPHDGFAAL